jgi:hypothetical protein
MQLDKNKIIYAVLFIVTGFILSNINFTKIAGSEVSFTLLDFFAPTAGAFLGTPIGVVAVLFLSIIRMVVGLFSGAEFTIVSVLRLLPTLFAVVYFSKINSSSKGVYLLPLVSIIAMIGFWINPIGREAWVYALFWLIPVVMFFFKNNLFARALGSTFTAHAVGGLMWVWAFDMPASLWLGLIPVVAVERLLFALGITFTYLLFNNILAKLSFKNLLPKGLIINDKYLIKLGK